MLNRKVRVYGSLGVTFSYNIGANNTMTMTRYTPNKVWDDQANNIYHWGEPTQTSETTPYEMKTARDVRWNYGWLGGAGLSVLAGRFEIFAEWRYYYGMTDILRTGSRYIFNEEESIRSELDNMNVTMGITFRLGKGGILAPPLNLFRRGAKKGGGVNFNDIKSGR
jgi:hypothetical protein